MIKVQYNDTSLPLHRGAHSMQFILNRLNAWPFKFNTRYIEYVIEYVVIKQVWSNYSSLYHQDDHQHTLFAVPTFESGHVHLMEL